MNKTDKKDNATDKAPESQVKPTKTNETKKDGTPAKEGDKSSTKSPKKEKLEEKVEDKTEETKQTPAAKE